MVLVSHSDELMRRICNTMLWMETASVRVFGPTSAVLDRYLSEQD